jgi:hypothetical protein
MTERDPQMLGTTAGDKMFHNGSVQHFPLSNNSREDSKRDTHERDESPEEDASSPEEGQSEDEESA